MPLLLYTPDSPVAEIVGRKHERPAPGSPVAHAPQLPPLQIVSDVVQLALVEQGMIPAPLLRSAPSQNLSNLPAQTPVDESLGSTPQSPMAVQLFCFGFAPPRA